MLQKSDIWELIAKTCTVLEHIKDLNHEHFLKCSILRTIKDKLFNKAGKACEKKKSLLIFFSHALTTVSKMNSYSLVIKMLNAK